MLVLAARYAFIFWLFISSNNDDQLRLRQMEAEDQSIYRTAACTARCLKHQQLEHIQEEHRSLLEHCLKICQDNENSSFAAPTANLRKIHENYNLKLICRDDRSLKFRIDLEDKNIVMEITDNNSMANSDSITTMTKNRYAETIYVIKVHVAKKAEEFLVYLSDENSFSIDDLKNYTVHNITAIAVHANNEYSVIAKEQQYATLARSYTPGRITGIIVKKFSVDPANELLLLAQIEWMPAADLTCHYNIICFSTKSGDYDLPPIEIRDPRQLYTYTLENLKFSHEYKVGIRAKNPNNLSKESELFWHSFPAPACVDWHNYNFNICAPLDPEGLEVELIFVTENVYDLNITWQLPQHLPDFYTIIILDLDENGTRQDYNISKQFSSLYIKKITLTGIMYEVHLTAYTHGGNATVIVNDQITKRLMISTDKHHIVKLISAILAPVFCIGILSLTVFMVCHRRAKLKRYQERCKYFEELEKKAPIDPKATFDFATKNAPTLTISSEDLAVFQLELENKILFNDAMEIERDDVTLHEILGEGAFGLVRRGIFKANKLDAREVAVKMLKDEPTLDDMRAFRREIEVMKSVERHPNIVGIIGHCTKRSNEMMLLTEYCSLGNLLDFLRNEWKFLHELQVKTQATASLMPIVPQRISTVTLQHYKEQTHKKCKKNNNNDEDIFNIDANIISKFKSKYKNIESTHKQKNNDKVSQNETKSTAKKPTTTTTAAINKSYGYEEICTNSCKCQVNISTIENVDAADDANQAAQLQHMLQQQQQQQLPQQQQQQQTSSNEKVLSKTIEIKNCNCQHVQLAKKNKQNVDKDYNRENAPQPPVENRTYIKYLVKDATSPQCQLRKLQQKQQHNNAKECLIKSIKRVPLSDADLLDIAKQVAVGMEFLAKNKVVHRDLAARNVLVSPNRTIKIADFGLSRDIYQENIYKKMGNGKLPIKWLALESMTHQVYTTQSDVWSYGILLYEISTLGGTPYPSIPTNRLLHLLKTGYRMEKPHSCRQEFYNLMLSCWHVNPTERPNFNEIIKILVNLMCDAPQQQNKDVITLATVDEVQNLSAVNEDCYLKPLQ